MTRTSCGIILCLSRGMFHPARDPRAQLLSDTRRNASRHPRHPHCERRHAKLRIGFFRVLCFALGGRGRLPMETRPLVKRYCEPTISVFDPPTYPVASWHDATSNSHDPSVREALWSSAAAPPGLGQHAHQAPPPSATTAQDHSVKPEVSQ
jgi:hypothetical protein